MTIYLTEEQLHKLVSGKNKAFMTRTINTQKRKYHNTGIFELIINTHENKITIYNGESRGEFIKYYKTNKWVHDYGNLYNAKQCTDIVNEVAEKIGL